MSAPHGSFWLPRKLKPEHRRLAARQLPHLFKAEAEPEPYREVEISKGAFELLEAMRLPVLFGPDIFKAAGHKYIRREPKPGGGYKYFYNTNTKDALKIAFKVGEAFLMYANDADGNPTKGHFHVKAVDGDSITIEHDESGLKREVTRAELARMLYEHHKKGLREKQHHHAEVQAHGAAKASADRALLRAIEVRRAAILAIRRQPCPPKPPPVFEDIEPDDDIVGFDSPEPPTPVTDAADKPKPKPAAAKRAKERTKGGKELTTHWEKKIGYPDLGERWSDEEAREWITEAGNDLARTQRAGMGERDDSGLNNYDTDIWPDVVAGGDLDEMRYILRKYWRQLDAESFFRAGLADALKRMNDVIEPRVRGPMVLLPAKRLSDFRGYLAVQKRFKKHGLFFIGEEKTWALRGRHVMDFPFEAYCKALQEVGVEVEDQAWPPPGFTPPKTKSTKPEAGDEGGFDRATIDQVTVDDLLHAMKNRQVEDVAVIRRAKGLPGVTDGAWVVNSTFSREFNAIVNNREGSLSGIMEYRKELDHARVTHSLELVEELLEQMKEKMPDFAIRVDGLEEARAERESHKAAMQKPIPEVHEKLGTDDLGETFKLMPHQNEGVRFLQRNGGNGIIGDEMGLGKTLIVLSYSATNAGSKTLVVAPKAVRHQWLDEAERFFPGHYDGAELTTAKLNKAKKEIERHRAEYRTAHPGATFESKEAEDRAVIRHALGLDSANLATINYEAIGKLEPYLDGFDTLVVDESHRVKNPKAQVTRNIQRLAKGKEHRILMSGTAIKNKKSELFTQTEIVSPGLFPSASDLNMATIGGAFHKMKEVYIARRKSDVMKHLPPKTRAPLRIEIPELNDAVERYIEIAAIRKEQRTGQVVWTDPKSPDFQDMSRLKAEMARGKVPYTLDFVKELLNSQDGKVIVFSDSKEAAKKIAGSLGPAAVLHTGDTPDKKRLEIVKQFQDPESKQRVFVATTASAGVGLNLQVADKVVFNDLPWTPADQEQAEDRAHRATSKKPVNVYAVTAEANLWDELILETLSRKRVLKEKMLAGKKISEEDRRWAEQKISPQELLRDLIARKNGAPAKQAKKPKKPAGQKSKKAASKKKPAEAEEMTKLDRDILALQDTYRKITGGRKEPVRLVELRAKSKLPRAELDAVIAAAIDRDDVSVYPEEEARLLTPADHAAAFNQSGVPKHHLFFNHQVFTPSERAQVDKNMQALHAAYMELTGGKLERDVKLDALAKKAGVSEADAQVALQDARDRDSTDVEISRDNVAFYEAPKAAKKSMRPFYLPRRLKPEHRALALAQFPDLFKSREAGYREVQISKGAFLALALSGVQVVSGGDLLKAAGHKYIRREPKPGGGYKYFYNTADAKTLSLDLKGGETIKIAHGGKQGHFHVDKVDGGLIHLTHGSSKTSVKVTRAELAKLMHQQYAGEIKEKEKQHEAKRGKKLHGAAKAANERALKRIRAARVAIARARREAGHELHGDGQIGAYSERVDLKTAKAVDLRSVATFSNKSSALSAARALGWSGAHVVRVADSKKSKIRLPSGGWVYPWCLADGDGQALTHRALSALSDMKPKDRPKPAPVVKAPTGPTRRPNEDSLPTRGAGGYNRVVDMLFESNGVDPGAVDVATSAVFEHFHEDHEGVLADRQVKNILGTKAPPEKLTEQERARLSSGDRARGATRTTGKQDSELHNLLVTTLRKLKPETWRDLTRASPSLKNQSFMDYVRELPAGSGGGLKGLALPSKISARHDKEDALLHAYEAHVPDEVFDKVKETYAERVGEDDADELTESDLASSEFGDLVEQELARAERQAQETREREEEDELWRERDVEDAADWSPYAYMDEDDQAYYREALERSMRPRGSFTLPRHLKPKHRALARKQFPELFKSLPPPPPGRLTLPKRLKPEHRRLAARQFPELFKAEAEPEPYREVEISKGAFELLEAMGLPALFGPDIFKAAGHKYIRREPKPGGGYNYFYNESPQASVHRFHVGEAVEISDAGKHGSFHVESVRGAGADRVVHLRHDATGLHADVSSADLRAMRIRPREGHAARPAAADGPAPSAHPAPPEGTARPAWMETPQAKEVLKVAELLGEDGFSEEDAKTARLALRRLVTALGCGHRVPAQVGKSPRMQDTLVVNPKLNDLASYNLTTGVMQISPTTQALLRELAGGSTSPRAFDALVTLFHEELHACSPTAGGAYVSSGKVIEEVGTEALARHMARTIFGPQCPVQPSHLNSRERSVPVSYQNWMDLVLQAIVDARVSNDRMDAESLLISMTVEYKKGADFVSRPKEAEDRWIKALNDTCAASGRKMPPTQARERLRKALRRVAQLPEHELRSPTKR